MNEEELRRSIAQLLDGRLSQEDRSAMESAIVDNVDFQRIYLNVMQVHASLAWQRRWSVNNPVRVCNTNSAELPRRRANRLALCGLVATAAATLLFLSVREIDRSRDSNPSAVVADSSKSILDPVIRKASLEAELPLDESVVGVLSDVSNVVWSAGSDHPVDRTLQKGWLRFNSGIIKIDFFGGARLIVRGPAELQLRSSSEALLRSGEATCYVGELGRGFRLLTGDSEVIDLGTSFGMRVVPNQSPEVHVFEGKIAIRHSSTPEPTELNEHSAVRLDSDQLSPVTYSKKRFPAFEDFKAEQSLHSQHQYVSWKASTKKLSLDPSVLVHYTFEDQRHQDIEVLNQAKSKTTGSPGAIVGATWGEGRWPNKAGLHFRDRSDRVLFRVPGEFESLTFLIWARIDALMGERTALLMSENPTRWVLSGSMKPSELHETVARQDSVSVKTSRWILDRAGRPSFNLAFDDPRPATFQWDAYTSKDSIAKRSDWGQWSCIAMTFHASDQAVIHYVNGKPIQSLTIERAETLLLQCMELGNLTRPRNSNQGVDNFRFYGVIDEVLIAKRAFTEQEISAIYESGNNSR